MTLLAGFAERRFAAKGVEINAAVGGAGPPLLLLHGYPQTHAMWHRIAPALAERYTVVAADLRGYGDSAKPAAVDGTTYSKRTMAADMVAVMGELGHSRFRLAGHDRGGRVAYRLALDHPDVVEKIAVLDIVPTKTIYDATDRMLATYYFHWFFLIQRAPLPETLIGRDPQFWLETIFNAWTGTSEAFTPAARAEYLRCFASPGGVAATCEDYRAGAGADCEDDAASLAADARVAAPLLALWGKRGVVGARFDCLAEWRRYAADVRGEAVNCGHFLPEEAPEPTLRALLAFFA